MSPDSLTSPRPRSEALVSPEEVARRRAVGAPIWVAFTGAMLCVLAPVLLVRSTPLSNASSPHWWLALVLVIVVGVRFAWIVGEGAPRLFELITWLFTYVFMGLAPLVQMRSGQYPQTTPDIDASQTGRAMAIVIVGAAALAFGMLVAGRPAKNRRPVTTATVHPTLLLMLSGFGLLVAAYVAMKVGFAALFSTREQRSQRESALWGNPTILAIIKAAASYSLIVSFAGLVKLRRRRAVLGLKGPSLLPLVVFGMLLLVVNPVTSPRYVFGTSALAVAASLGIVRTPRRMRTFALSLALGLVLVFPYADFARTADPNAEVETVGPAAKLSTGDFDAFDQIVNAVTYVENEGHTGGRQLMGAALFFVPRAAWPAKPEDTGIFLANYKGYWFTNLSAPMWAEFFIDGGWWLLVLGMGTVGFLVRKLDNRTVLDYLTRDGPTALGVITPFYLVILLRGSLLQAMAGFTVLFLCGFAVRRRIPVDAVALEPRRRMRHPGQARP